MVWVWRRHRQREALTTLGAKADTVGPRRQDRLAKARVPSGMGGRVV